MFCISAATDGNALEVTFLTIGAIAILLALAGGRRVKIKDTEVGPFTTPVRIVLGLLGALFCLVPFKGYLDGEASGGQLLLEAIPGTGKAFDLNGNSTCYFKRPSTPDPAPIPAGSALLSLKGTVTFPAGTHLQNATLWLGTSESYLVYVRDRAHEVSTGKYDISWEKRVPVTQPTEAYIHLFSDNSQGDGSYLLHLDVEKAKP
jgi:hypothetical protein